MTDETASQDMDDENCTDITCAVFKKPVDFRITLQEESIELSTLQTSSSQSLQNQISSCNSSSVNDSDSQKENNVSISKNSSILSNIVHPRWKRRLRNVLKEEKQCDANFSMTESPCSIVEEKKVGYLRKSCKQNEKLRENVDYTFSKAFDKQCDANFSTTESSCSIVEEKKVGYLRKSCNEKLHDVEFSGAYDSFDDLLLSKRFKKHHFDKACENVDCTFSKAFDSWDKTQLSEARSSLLNEDSNLPSNSLNTETYVIEETIGLSTNSFTHKESVSTRSDCGDESYSLINSENVDITGTTRNTTQNEMQSSLVSKSYDSPLHLINEETSEELVGSLATSLTDKDCVSIRNEHENEKLVGSLATSLTGKDCVSIRNEHENEKLVGSLATSLTAKDCVSMRNEHENEKLVGSLATSLTDKDCVSIRNEHENEKLVGSLATSLTVKDCVSMINEHEDESGSTIKIKNINDIEISRNTTMNETQSLSSNEVPELPLQSVDGGTFIEEIVGLSVTSFSCKDSVSVKNDCGSESHSLLNNESVDITGTFQNIRQHEVQSSLFGKSSDIPHHSVNAETSEELVGSLATSLTHKDCISIRNEHENESGSTIKIEDVNNIEISRSIAINETQSLSSNEVPELPLHSVNGETVIEEIVGLSVTSLSCKDSVSIRNDYVSESYSLLNIENVDIVGTSQNITQNEVQSSLLGKSSDFPLHSVNTETSEELVGSLTSSLTGKDCVSIRNEHENEGCSSMKIKNINDTEISENTMINKTQSPSLNEVPELPLQSVNIEANIIDKITDTSLAPQSEKNYASMTNSMVEGPRTRSRTVLSNCSANSLIRELFNEERSSEVQSVQSKSDFPLNSVNAETSEELVDSLATSLPGNDCVSIKNERENEGFSSIKIKNINEVEISGNTMINETQSPSLNEAPELSLHSMNIEANVVDEINDTSLAPQSEKNYASLRNSTVERPRTRSQTLLSGCSANSLTGKLFNKERSSAVQSLQSKSDFPLNSVNVETSEEVVDSLATSLTGKDCVSIRNERENEDCSSIKIKNINDVEISENTINETQSSSLNEVPELPLHSVNMEVDEITDSSLVPQSEKNFIPLENSMVEGSQTRSRTLRSDCNSANSLIGKLFNEEISSAVQSVPSKKTRKKRKYSGKLLDYDDDKKKNTLVNSLPKKPHFPKFDRYMGEHFYKYLILKMEPKYGLRTNREVVKVAEFIYKTVKEVICANTNYSDKVEEMKFLLARKQVIRTHLEFYFYCFNYLPPYFNAKAVPMLQPCGKPPLIEFNLDIICDPVIPSSDIVD